jgi:hypothetical protein
MGIKLRTTAKKPKNPEKRIPEIELEPESPAFGELTLPSNPFLGVDLSRIDPDQIGQNYRIIPPDPVVEEVFDAPPPEPAPIPDKRTSEDMRLEALQQIVNQLDVPDELVVQLQKKLGNRIDELTSFLLTDVIPSVLAVSPALDAVRKTVPRALNDENLDFDLESELISFATRVGALRAKAYIVDDLLKLPADWKAAFFTRQIKEET